jgi:acetyl esterase
MKQRSASCSNACGRLPEAARNVLAVAQKSVSVTLAPARSDDRILNVGPKGRTDIQIFRPENANGTLPVVIYTHGGGWVLGDRGTHDRLIRADRRSERRRGVRRL